MAAFALVSGMFSGLDAHFRYTPSYTPLSDDFGRLSYPQLSMEKVLTFYMDFV